MMGRRTRLGLGVALVLGLGTAVLARYDVAGVGAVADLDWRGLLVTDEVKRREIAEAERLLAAEDRIVATFRRTVERFGRELAGYPAIDDPAAAERTALEVVETALPPDFETERLTVVASHEAHAWLLVQTVAVEGATAGTERLVRGLFRLGDPTAGRQWTNLVVEADAERERVRLAGELEVAILLLAEGAQP